ncbi:uncharacterized protein [Aegilops tauschii subsp. strangulata]|uniref:Wound-responsive family protein n=1 Tax=Aegilops tauschii TaxID=37682 RepID=N1QV39_AEGTA|nr:uncharacterized protein LOC109771609 [Aegilops tauschii subsp. strangulata]XP_044329199.1 uncharacterized protein LOC123050475 [Triticum aestivum]
MASGGGKVTASSWAAAMSVGAGTVEALKERHAGLCRWNYHALPCVLQHAGNGKTMAAPAAGGAAARRRKARQEQEEELRTVMYLSNWGPNN